MYRFLSIALVGLILVNSLVVMAISIKLGFDDDIKFGPSPALYLGHCKTVEWQSGKPVVQYCAYGIAEFVCVMHGQSNWQCRPHK